MGPQLFVQHADLFQDNFAQDGTLTGTARADGAQDILQSSNSGILPADSVVATIGGLAEVGPGLGPRAYLYVAVWPLGSKTGASLGSTDTRSGKAGPRFPYAGSETINSITWERFQLDTVFAYNTTVTDRYCVDLNDALFTPGDTICYFFGADADGIDNNGTENYWHRSWHGQGESHVTSDITEAAANACEFTILPTDPTGTKGIDILFVDGADDRGGPIQLLFDNTFAQLGLNRRVDRYDVVGAGSVASNGVASRVKNPQVQFISAYKIVILNSGNVPYGIIGDGFQPEKSDDFGLLEMFIRTSPMDPGLLLMGDNLAEEWVTLYGAGAQNLKDDWIPFSLREGSHVLYGESVTPVLTATGFSFIHSGDPDEFYIYGGCPVLSNFDVIRPLSNGNVTSMLEFPYPATGEGAVISAQALNNAQTWYTIVLAGFGFESIGNVGANGGSMTAGLARTEFLYDVLVKMGNFYLVTGVDPDSGPELVNALEANYPNPFNPVTTIRYRIKEKAHLSLRIYNAAGQLVRTLVDQVQSPSDVKPLTWDGTNSAGQTVSSGVYFYKLVTKDFAQTRKMVLLK